MMDVGRVCVKVAGRDAGRLCVIVDVLDKTYVLIDGQTRRRKCNVQHLEPLKQTVDVRKGASHDAIVSAFKEMKIEIAEPKPRKATSRPVRQRQAKSKQQEDDQTREGRKVAKPVQKKASAKESGGKSAPKKASAIEHKSVTKKAPVKKAASKATSRKE
ncbi:MAG: 50S ribosomal protein L14e [Nitrosarchaeum sp.]|nr:50S ribosomal protein L14e [Nitrosarchaeum sp.]